MIVIVLYETKLADSLTFMSLKKMISVSSPCDRIDLLICDNSPKEQIDFEQANADGIFSLYYLHDPLNPGVSKSYNRAAELANIYDKSWLLVLDQDTLLPMSTILEYQRAIDNFRGYPIYAPQVYSGPLLFSPCKYFFRKGSNLKEVKPGIHPMTHRNVLNSGLLINLEAFRKVGGYDENVELYFSDFVFFDRLKKYFNEFIVIDCKFEHQLSSVDHSSIDTALTRFSYYCIGARQASYGNTLAYFNHSITIGLRSFLMSYRFRSLKFFKVYFQDFLIS